MEEFTKLVVKIIENIPFGKIATYGSISLVAGKSNGARQVARILHSMSRKHSLPWHRVINSRGYISLPKENGYYLQKQLLQMEGITFGINDKIDLNKYGWKPSKIKKDK